MSLCWKERVCLELIAGDSWLCWASKWVASRRRCTDMPEPFGGNASSVAPPMEVSVVMFCCTCMTYLG